MASRSQGVFSEKSKETLLRGACLFEMSLFEIYCNNQQLVKLEEYRDICNVVDMLQKEGKCTF